MIRWTGLPVPRKSGGARPTVCAALEEYCHERRAHPRLPWRPGTRRFPRFHPRQATARALSVPSAATTTR